MPKINDHYRPGLRCSFCGKSQEEVRKLIAGPDVYICDECIALCNEILAEEEGEYRHFSTSSSIPKPSEIKEVLDEYVIGQDILDFLRLGQLGAGVILTVFQLLADDVIAELYALVADKYRGTGN